MRDLSHTISQKPSKSSHISPYVINVGIGVCTLTLALTYLFSINSMATQGYKIKQLNTQLTKLEAERNSLELQNSNLQSVSSIQEKTQKLNFVPTTNVTYIKDDNFALR